MKRLVAIEPGGLDQLRVVDGPVPDPGPNDVRVAIAYSGMNFIDVYFRKGTYKSDLPIALGSEGAGVVETVGSAVTGLTPGDRVVYAMHRGSHAEYAVVPATAVAKVPDSVDLRTAAAVMLQGTTAHYLTRSTFPLDATHTCLVHAAAGGAGGLTVQLAKRVGARVIGTASTAVKLHEAASLGADHVVNYTTHDFEEEVKTLTGGRGVDVVYDSVGHSTFDKSLKVIRPRGMMVLFGQSSGPVAPMEPTLLNVRGSLFLTRPSLAHYLATPDEVAWRVSDIMNLVAAGQLIVRIAQTVAMADAADAYRDLEGRKTIGKIVIAVRPDRDGASR